MAESEVVALLGKAWPRLNHHSARAYLDDLGWEMFAQGDWAYAYRSPSGRLVARVSPFEPGYGYFVDLCDRCAGNRYVPRLDLATELEGGGHLAVLEHLSPLEASEVRHFLRCWNDPEEGDEDLRALRREVDLIDHWGRQNVRGWIGIDIGDRHVLRSSDGNVKVLDLFGVDWGFLEDLVNDPHGFVRRIPPDRCRYLADMPDLQADDHPADYLPRIRAALAEAMSQVEVGPTSMGKSKRASSSEVGRSNQDDQSTS